MLYPSINLLKTKVDSRYTLVVMAAKRARDLVDGKPKLTLMESNKPVSIATYEISDDLISYNRAQTSASDEPERD
ncbi:MAG TPA: DNA-directed RNA polymerase subunit omega [Clostridiales bacterium]|nr:DNA-directed RNA polymerase subunit omega [Clostridiales bacterium]